jgi:hypothetical protein
MGCGGIDADVQTDYQIQGAWLQGDYTLYINAASMVVKYFTDVSTPYRTEFSYGAGGATASPILGTFTLFDYKSNDEIAGFDVSCVPGESLTISNITWTVEEYYYSNAFPIAGTYANVADALVQSGYTDVAADDFDYDTTKAALSGTKAELAAEAMLPVAANIKPKADMTAGKITITGFTTDKTDDTIFPATAAGWAALINTAAVVTGTKVTVIFDVAVDKVGEFKAAEDLELEEVITLTIT